MPLVLTTPYRSQSYQDIILGTTSATVIAYWPFDGDALDATGNGYDLTKHPNATYVTGQVEQGMEFPVNVSGQATGSHSFASNFFDDWSAEAWVYVDAEPGTFKPIISLYGVGPRYEFNLITGSNFPNGPAKLQVNINGAVYNSSNVVPLDTWTHVAMSSELNVGGGINVYVNGSGPTSIGGTSNDFDGSSSTYVGGFPGNTPIDGIYDEVVLYQGIISAADVLAHYNAGL